MSDVAARTGGRLLARNSALNLVGWVLPMAAALVTVPLLIRGLGAERFGILTVGWVVLGYFGLFDLGVGRALTKMVSERLGTEHADELPPLVWTALLLMFLLGVAGAVVLALLAPWLVGHALKISPEYEGEALRTLYLLAFSLPWVISATGFSGILEANQSFGLVSGLRVPMGLFTYLSPLAVLPFSHSLVPVIALLVAGRIVAWAAHLAACLHVLPLLRRRVGVEWGRARGLMQLGGWMTVSNVVSPLMTYFDRFLIGGLISMAAVAYYVTPYELVTKLLMIPTALFGVLFPALAATFALDRSRTELLLGRGVRALFLLMFPVTLVVVTLAEEGMRLWLGSAFASQSSGVLQWLAVGVFINCLAQAPFSLIHGAGRPDITGKLHLVELPLYAGAIYFLSRAFGLEGVAMAWVLRVAVDTAVLYVAAGRFLPGGNRLVWSVARMVAVALPLFGVGILLRESLGGRLFFLAATVLVFVLFGWYRVLQPAERALFQRRQPALDV
ncbi:MAG: flippase [Longimicrobiaceae bacterium]|jgi:O-antigen/teichoic acid export membrane protein